jgi:probable phosphoglycerate mutase
MTIVSDVPADEGPRRFPQGRFRAPEGACELLLVRHGQSEDAVEGVEFATFEGHADPPLSTLGREQAEALASRLVTEHIDALYVTSLRRTAESAAPLAAATGLRPVVEHDLREIHLGEWEGWVFEQKFVDRDPVALRMVAEERWDVVPGCEPVVDFRARVQAAVGRIAAAHRDQRVVVVVHGGVIGEILALAAASRPWAFVGADNASISHLVVTEHRWIVRRFNDTTHLDPRLSVRAAPLI